MWFEVEKDVHRKCTRLLSLLMNMNDTHVYVIIVYLHMYRLYSRAKTKAPDVHFLHFIKRLPSKLYCRNSQTQITCYLHLWCNWTYSTFNVHTKLILDLCQLQKKVTFTLFTKCIIPSNENFFFYFPAISNINNSFED